MRNHLVWCCLVLSICLIACKKNKIQADVTDKSLSIEMRLNKIKFLGDKAFMVGGERFTQAHIYSLENEGNAQDLALPSTASQKEIYGLDIRNDGHIIAVGYDGSVFTSKDSGMTWSFSQHGMWKEFQAVAIGSDDSALVVGGHGFREGIIAHISNEGNGSIALSELRNFEMSDIEFASTNRVYISGYGAILRSNDAGSTWNFTHAKNEFFKAMAWQNEETGIAIGYEGSIYKTSDGGNGWRVIRNGNNFLKKKYHFLDIAKNNSDTYVIVGEEGTVWLSTNGGEDWKELSTFTKKELRGVAFKNENTFITVGEKGAIFSIKI
jgi:photosystem II stability/assembly factor-like uncharacterized protein